MLAPPVFQRWVIKTIITTFAPEVNPNCGMNARVRLLKEWQAKRPPGCVSGGTYDSQPHLS
jgi:hypothetical protein